MNVQSSPPLGWIGSEIKDPRLVAERRRELADVAIGLFTRGGYHATPIRYIARAAGVSVGSIYCYFPSKDAILEFACAQVVDALEPQLRARASDAHLPARQRVERLFSTLVSAVDAASDLHLLIYRESAALEPRTRERITEFEHTIRGMFAGLLTEGIACGELGPHDAALRAETLVMLAHMWALKRWWLRGKISVRAYIAEQLRTTLDGIDASLLRETSRPGGSA